MNNFLNKAREKILSKKDSNRRPASRGLLKNPSFYFFLGTIILFSSIYASCDSSSSISDPINSRTVFFNPFFNKNNIANADTIFSSKTTAIPLETPDLKIMQDNTLCAVSAPCVVSGKVLGDIFGSNGQKRKEVVDYVVQPGDSLQGIATAHDISLNTLLWANDLASSSPVKVGQSLAILPIDGVLHIVKSGDTMSAIAQKYKAVSDDIISYNGLINQDDIYIGDILIIPGGTMPKKATPIINYQAPLADNFFIFPTQGLVTQGLHYMNAVDVANKCGTAIYAAASGTIERAVFNNAWNLGKGNYVTILHSNGTVTYYGHLQAIFVKPGDKINVGDRIGLMGRTGQATGCHLHFQVMGAKNPLSKYSVGSKINY